MDTQHTFIAAHMYCTYTRTLPQNPFHSAPVPIVWPSPLQLPIRPSLFPLSLLLQPPQVSSQWPPSRSSLRRRSEVLSTTTTAVPSATGPRCLEPWPLLGCSRYCHCHCTVQTHTALKSGDANSVHTHPKEDSTKICGRYYFCGLPLGETWEKKSTHTVRHSCLKYSIYEHEC